MPYFPSIALFRTQARLLDVAKAVVAELEDGFLFGSPGSSVPLAPGAALEFLRNQKDVLPRFGISRPPLQLVFSGPLPSGSLHVEAWEPDPDGSGDISPQVKSEWRSFILRLHRILVRDCGAVVSFASAHDNHSAGQPDAYGTGELVGLELKAQGAAGLRALQQSSFFIWILGINKTAFREDLNEYTSELTQVFHIVEETPHFLVLENKEVMPIFLLGSQEPGR